MEFDKIKNKGQGRLFHYTYVEMLTKTHPIVIYSIYLPVIIFMLYYGAAYRDMEIWKEVTLFVSGIFFWTVFEYFAHRYIFHHEAKSERGKKITYMIHGVHHEFPRDKERLFMPPVPSIIIAIVIFSIFYLILHTYAFSFFPGFLFGYLVYGSMHFAIHAYAPPKFLKALWRNHHLHHYKSDTKGYGVSSVLWDIVFGTVPEKD
jgi:sterol desaturase/sphingolipid hydroxylase (fatty acid hydroxylase superfamily)